MSGAHVPFPGTEINRSGRVRRSLSLQTRNRFGIGLDEIFFAIRTNRRTVVTVAMLVFIALSIFVVLDKPVYRAYVTLAPSSPLVDPNRLPFPNILAQIGFDHVTDFGVIQARTSPNESYALLTSRSIGRLFIESEDLMPILFAEQWNPSTSDWRDSDPDHQPSIDDGLELFEREIRFISKNEATGFVRINIEWTDPRLAESWANRLVELTDELIRQRDIDEAESSVKFLQQQADSVSLDSVRQLIYSLIESYTKSIMVARVKENYAFTIIDPAVAPRADQPINMPVSFRLSLALLLAISSAILYVVVKQRLSVSGMHVS